MTQWLLWSNQERGFWRRNLLDGVTHDLAEAERFTFQDAVRHCFEAARLEEPLATIDGHEMPHVVMMAAPPRPKKGGDR